VFFILPGLTRANPGMYQQRQTTEGVLFCPIFYQPGKKIGHFLSGWYCPIFYPVGKKERLDICPG